MELLLTGYIKKAEIRILSKEMGLPTWDKPATACLSSRFPYGVEITPQRIRQVGQCEERLRMLGLRHFRARYHEELVRLELGQEELAALLLGVECSSRPLRQKRRQRPLELVAI